MLWCRNEKMIQSKKEKQKHELYTIELVHNENSESWK